MLKEKVNSREFVSIIYSTMNEFIDEGGTADDIPMQNWVGNMSGIADDLGYFNDMLVEIHAQNNQAAMMFGDLFTNYLARSERKECV